MGYAMSRLEEKKKKTEKECLNYYELGFVQLTLVSFNKLKTWKGWIAEMVVMVDTRNKTVGF